MKKIAYLLLIAGALGSISAQAQSKFEGVYGQIGIGYESVAPSTSTSVSYGGV